jgi:hypothetical protein
MKKRGQLKLSFGMIFSIILIVIFIALAGYTIMKFLSLQNSVKVAQFKDNLQEDVDKLWRGTQGQREIEYYLPGKIEKVCFIDYENIPTEEKETYNKLKRNYYNDEIVFFYPENSGEGLNAFSLKHFSINSSTEKNNPLCYPNLGGKVTIKIRMDPGESLVKAIK